MMVDLRRARKKDRRKNTHLSTYRPFIAKFNRASRTLSGSSFFTGLGGRVRVDDLLDRMVGDDADRLDVEDAG